LGYFTTQLCELRRVFQEVHNLFHFFLSFIQPGNVSEGDLYLIFCVKQSRSRLANIKYLSTGARIAGHPSHQEPKSEQNEKQEAPVEKPACQIGSFVNFVPDPLAFR